MCVLGIWVLGVVSLFAVSSALASPMPRPDTLLIDNGPLIPPSFRIPATNGYSIFVLASEPYGGEPGSVRLYVQKGHTGAVYTVSAVVTKTSIAADLGALGRISVGFHPTGRVVTKRVGCTGSSQAIAEGSYEGTISFHGEDGYTDAETTSVPADVRPLLTELCSIGVSGGGASNPQGAELYIRNPGLGPRFIAIKAKPAGRAHFFVEVSEFSAGVSIERFASFSMPAHTFRYSAKLQSATIQPLAPFSGVARFDRHGKANRRWSGDLTVDVPGLSDAALTAPQLRAVLVHPESGRAGR